MLKDRDRANIEEVLYAIRHIEEYTQGIFSLSDLLVDTKTYDAVMMNFILIGEACKRLPKELKTANPQIDWKGINSYRNYIAHEYFGMDEQIVWGSIKVEVPNLKMEMLALLQSEQ